MLKPEILHLLNSSSFKTVLLSSALTWKALQLSTFPLRVISMLHLFYGASFVHSQYNSTKLHVQKLIIFYLIFHLPSAEAKAFQNYSICIF